MTICSLRPTIGRELALRRLSPSTPFGIFSRWFTGALRGIAEIYIPYHLYRVKIDDLGRESVWYYAVDAAAGTLDPYQFETPPEAEAWVEVETRNYHPLKLKENETRKLAIEKVRRQMFSRGFFRLAHPQMAVELIKAEFYIPYWAGFYGDERNVNIKVLNAVRQTLEGSKVRQAVKTWLLESPLDTEVSLPAGSGIPR